MQFLQYNLLELFRSISCVHYICNPCIAHPERKNNRDINIEYVLDIKVILLRGETTETGRRTKFRRTEMPSQVNKNVNRQPKAFYWKAKNDTFYRFRWHHPIITHSAQYINTVETIQGRKLFAEIQYSNTAIFSRLVLPD